jgi:hypothetical protein
MKRRLTIVLAVVVLSSSASAFAAKSSGDFQQITIEEHSQELGNGLTVSHAKTKIMTPSTQGNSPMDGRVHNCNNYFIVNQEGTPVAGSGHCFSHDGDGNGTWYDWTMNSGPSGRCPVACGTWRFTGGFGKFAGITGNGTWIQTKEFTDGSSLGKWENEYTMP